MAKAAAKPENERRTLEQLGVSIDEYENGQMLSPALDAAYAQLGISEDGADATIYVSLIDAKTQKEARIWDGPVEDWDMKAIAQKFGSGDYRVKLYTRIPTGQKVQQQNKIITWQLSAEDDARLKLLRENPQALQNAGTMQPQAQGITKDDLIAAIKAATPQQPAGPSITEIMTLVTGLMAAMNKPAAPVATTPAVNPMDMVKLIIGAMNDSRARSSEDDDTPRRGTTNANDIWLKLIDRFAPLFGQVLQNGVAVQQTGALPAPAPAGVETAAIAGAPPANDTIQPEGEDMNAVQKAQLRMGLRFLVAQAEQNLDVQTYAEVALDSIGDEAARVFLAQSDPIAGLIEIEPEVGNHRKWFGDLLECCKELLAEDDDTGDGGSK